MKACSACGRIRSVSCDAPACPFTTLQNPSPSEQSVLRPEMDFRLQSSIERATERTGSPIFLASLLLVAVAVVGGTSYWLATRDTTAMLSPVQSSAAQNVPAINDRPELEGERSGADVIEMEDDAALTDDGGADNAGPASDPQLPSSPALTNLANVSVGQTFVDGDVAFRVGSRQVLRLATPNRSAVIVVGQSVDECHACSGIVKVQYFEQSENGQSIASDILSAPAGSWGQIAGMRVRQDLGNRQMLEIKSAGGGQGCSVEVVEYIELRDAGPFHFVTRIPILLDFEESPDSIKRYSSTISGSVNALKVSYKGDVEEDYYLLRNGSNFMSAKPLPDGC